MNNRHFNHVLHALLLVALSLPAAGHHFKGLPHFAYFENYPQVPQDEFLAQQGEFECSLVIYDFQGINKADTEQPNDARLFLAIFNLRENRVYNGRLKMTVLDHGDPIYSETVESGDSESLYLWHQSLPPEGRYAINLELLDAESMVMHVPFVLSSQRVHWGKWIAAGLGLLIVVVAVGSRRRRIAIDRAQNAKNRRHGEVRELTEPDDPQVESTTQ
ncbi:MAG: hypothetical protein QGF67_20515 [Lentisphaeria bacterium]|nr:hypothetical protein [Lentisphaeria bacterium]MDP7743838.1 hypothetical protein [Lentisphaeria bacterium]